MPSKQPKPSIFINDLDQIDLAYPSNGGIEGKSFIVDVELEGKLDDNGFILDFSLAKAKIKKILKDTADHALILPNKRHQMKIDRSSPENVDLLLHFSNETWAYNCPLDAIYEIEHHEFDVKVLEKTLNKSIQSQLGSDVQCTTILREKKRQLEGSLFHYTHGITGHLGLCQRLFHGHTGELSISSHISSLNPSSIEKDVIDNFFKRSTHIAAKDQMVSSSSTKKSMTVMGTNLLLRDYHHISYTGSKGRFEALIPKNKVIILDQTPSIENTILSVHQYIHSKHGENVSKNLKIHLMEGVCKGAKIS